MEMEKVLDLQDVNETETEELNSQEIEEIDSQIDSVWEKIDEAQNNLICREAGGWDVEREEKLEKLFFTQLRALTRARRRLTTKIVFLGQE